LQISDKRVFQHAQAFSQACAMDRLQVFGHQAAVMLFAQIYLTLATSSDSMACKIKP